MRIFSFSSIASAASKNSEAISGEKAVSSGMCVDEDGVEFFGFENEALERGDVVFEFGGRFVRCKVTCVDHCDVDETVGFECRREFWFVFDDGNWGFNSIEAFFFDSFEEGFVTGGTVALFFGDSP